MSGGARKNEMMSISGRGRRTSGSFAICAAVATSVVLGTQPTRVGVPAPEVAVAWLAARAYRVHE